MATDIDKALNENPVPRGKRETTVDLADSGTRYPERRHALIRRWRAQMRHFSRTDVHC